MTYLFVGVYFEKKTKQLLLLYKSEVIKFPDIHPDRLKAADIFKSNATQIELHCNNSIYVNDFRSAQKNTQKWSHLF